MSFLDLKQSVPTAENRRVPTYKRLLQEKQTIIAATSVGNAKITVYQNGYVIYEDGTQRTVMPIHRYGDYHYYFQDGIHVCISEKEFENLRWELRFLMEGESRIEHNRKNCALRHEAFSLRNDGTDWCSAMTVISVLARDERFNTTGNIDEAFRTEDGELDLERLFCYKLGENGCFGAGKDCAAK